MSGIEVSETSTKCLAVFRFVRGWKIMEWNNCHAFPAEDALEMILLFDQNGVITCANAAARTKLGYGEEICGGHISSIFPGVFKSAGETGGADAVFNGGMQNLMAYRKNLTCFPVEAKVVEKEESGIRVCMMNDMLEKEFLNKKIEQMEQETQQASKVKSEFVANVTHELRTPVNGILGNVRELLDLETDDRKLRSLHLMERCCEDMHKLINNILDFSKLDAGKFVLDPQKFNLREMLDYIKSNHVNRITEKGLEFFMTVSPQIPEVVVGDELRIVQILNNVLSNAQKFTSVGKISLEVLPTAMMDDNVELFFIVVDTGIGIDKADQDKLFKSFSQVDASISRKYGGTGLGLNICKQLVELMGGNISLESVRNKGTTVSFSIWVQIPEEEREAMAARREMFVPISHRDGEDGEATDIKEYGTEANREELKKNLSKLILCVEMENWEKAEMFMESIRQLTENAPREVSMLVLRLKMAVQKENYDKISVNLEGLKTLIDME